jgi:hypothetical protein
VRKNNKTIRNIKSTINVYIISTAMCEYYYSKLKVTQLPDFSSDFIYWMNRLSASNETEVTNFVKLEADSRSDLSNVKPPLQEILPE